MHCKCGKWIPAFLKVTDLQLKIILKIMVFNIICIYLTWLIITGKEANLEKWKVKMTAMIEMIAVCMLLLSSTLSLYLNGWGQNP